jgi:hypothetical protein
MSGRESMRFVTLSASLLVLAFLGSQARAGTSAQDDIDIATSVEQSNEARVAATNHLAETWQDSIPVLLRNIDTYYQSGSNPPYQPDTTGKLVPLTDILVNIVLNKDGAAQKFNESNPEKTVELLAAAAGGSERDLRFNSSYILAKVVDDDNLCVILHRLLDPDLGYSGQINLLQIAISGTNNASRENVEAAKETAEQLKKTAEGKITVLVSLLAQIARSREETAGPIPASSYCAQYNIETGVPAPAKAATEGSSP